MIKQAGSKKKRIIIILSLITLFIIISIFYYRFYFVFGDGTKAGTMNYFVHKGYVFKTYEGRLILSGVRSPAQGSIESNEFMFSVTDPAIAARLSQNAGGYVQLHYKEYFHTLPWRGVSTFVVDSIISVQKIMPSQP